MKNCIVEIQGGLGNQLFQLNFANYLKLKGNKVKLSIKLINKDIPGVTKREILIPFSFFNLKEVNVLEQTMLSAFLKIQNKSIFKENLKQRVGYFKGYDFNNSDLKSNNYFRGYWKNLRFLNKEFTINALSKNKLIDHNIRQLTNPGSTMLHIRRDDYLANGWELPLSFYKKSIDDMRTHKENFYYDIFTDDLEYVKSHKIFGGVNNVFSKSINPNYDDTLETFSMMLNYENYIVGNSSFSFWPAYINSTDKSRVVVADPWFKNSNHPTLKKANWHTVENK